MGSSDPAIDVSAMTPAAGGGGGGGDAGGRTRRQLTDLFAFQPVRIIVFGRCLER